MDYSSRIASLFERHRSVQTAGFSPDAYKPGLDAMRRLDAFLGHPHLEYPAVHVAGTNGKGSVCSMTAAALSLTGLRTGLYTSPHLLDFRERLKIISPGPEGPVCEMISEQEVCEFLDLVEGEGPGAGPFGSLTFFEITTGMAFWWFSRRGVDAAVIETGLGGRLDSTNIITPAVSVVTSIGLDHCDLLGSTLEAIASEKAGIFKPGVPALVWGRDAATRPVFEDAAARTGAPLYFAEDLVSLPQAPVTTEDLNLRTSLAALLLFTGREVPVPTDYKQITGLHARWEVLLASPLTIADIGHNPPALEANFARLEQLRALPEGGKRPLLVVYGAMADKDVDAIAALMPRDSKYFLVSPSTPRAMAASDLALKLKHLDASCRDSVALGVEAAMQQARSLADPIIYIGGSTYVAAEALTYIKHL